MCTKTSLDPASRCVRSPGNQGRRGGNDRRVARRAARTCATTMAIRATAEWWARPSGLPLCKRWTRRLSVSCDRPLEIARHKLPRPPRQSRRDLENHFQLHRHAQRKARHTVHTADRVLLFAENVLQQLRRGIGDLRLLPYIAKRSD